jgi:nitrogen fixation/metabolism regulation signal transduction histidine kinase
MRVQPAPYTLAYYESLAKGKPIAELNHAIQDVKATLAIHRERDTRDPYVAKLLAEFDAMTVELSRRRRLVK